MTVGVLALQGAFRNHLETLESVGVDAVLVNAPNQLVALDALVLPGGESTVMSKLLDSSGLRGPLVESIREGLPVFGTCAGMILLASDVQDGTSDQKSLGVLDISVRRNGEGSLGSSHESNVRLGDSFPGGNTDFPGVFIRPPVVLEISPDVEPLGWVDYDVGDTRIVMCRQGRVMATTFHPELTNDDRIHRAFLQSLQG